MAGQWYRVDPDTNKEEKVTTPVIANVLKDFFRYEEQKNENDRLIKLFPENIFHNKITPTVQKELISYQNTDKEKKEFPKNIIFPDKKFSNDWTHFQFNNLSIPNRSQFEEYILNPLNTVIDSYYYLLNGDRNNIPLKPLLFTDYYNIGDVKKSLFTEIGFPLPNIKIIIINKFANDRRSDGSLNIYIHFNAPLLLIDEEQEFHPLPKPTNEANTPWLVGSDPNKKLSKNWSIIYHEDEDGKSKWFPIPRTLQPRSDGGTNAAMRVDPIDEVEWVCEWVSVEGYKLGFALGLPNGIPSSSIFFYNPTNTPTQSLYKKNMPIEMVSEINYFKKFKPLESRRNKPDNPSPPRIPEISFRKLSDLYRKKVKGQELKHSQSKERQDAGTVMFKALNNYLLEELKTKGKLSATDYVQSLYVAANPSFQTVWDSHVNNNLWFQRRVTKLQPENTSQEWCHLYGHGDGGPERYDNFVAGSKHCNTEQLAIELGLRTGRYQGLIAKVTAYLFQCNGYNEITKEDLRSSFEIAMSTNISKPTPPSSQDKKTRKRGVYRDDSNPRTKFLKLIQSKIESEKQEGFIDVASFIADIEKNNTLDPNEKFFLEKFIQELQKLYIPFPIVQWMRYKIYYKDQKIFDHIYDGQSESFDANEFEILKTTVERVIAVAVNNDYRDSITNYEERINRRINKILETKPALGLSVSEYKISDNLNPQNDL